MRTWSLVALTVLAVWLAPRSDMVTSRSEAAGDQTRSASVPLVVATLPPLHSLTAMVMQGVGTPELLMEGSHSPHGAQLKPSQRRAIANADLVVWAGPGIEAGVARAIAASENGPRSLPMVAQSHYGHGGDDHAWLDPLMAQAFLNHIGEVLIALDPQRTKLYLANVDYWSSVITQRLSVWSQALAPARPVPFLVRHDAYGPLVRRYGLAMTGSITASPHQAPSAAHLSALRESINRGDAYCLFTEPQHDDDIAAILVEGTRARLGKLDPLGSTIPPGPAHYTAMMDALVGNLRSCLLGR